MYLCSEHRVSFKLTSETVEKWQDAATNLFVLYFNPSRQKKLDSKEISFFVPTGSSLI